MRRSNGRRAGTLVLLLVLALAGCDGGGDGGGDAGPAADVGQGPGGDTGHGPDVPAACVPRCDGRACGPDGCGGVCGACPAGAACGPDGRCVACARDCAGRSCGDDGCGGSCGTCAGGEACEAGVCVSCDPDCAGRACGGDGCGGSCGTCGGGESCEAGLCVPCAPDCAGRSCGGDGCGGSCGGCPAGEECDAAGACVRACAEDCRGRECGDDGCGGSCGTCPVGTACGAAGRCETGGCQPDCAGRSCGADGCGGACGVCPGELVCDDIGGRCEAAGCVPDCAGRQCGGDGCGGTCGDCAAGSVCQPSTGRCAAGCQPDCAGRSCGPDGCGGTCGACAPGAVCRESDGRCLASCTPQCGGRACGPDGCGATCGACPQGWFCDDGACALPAHPAVDWCRFQWPLAAEAAPLERVTAYVRLFEAGVTDRTGAADPDPGLAVELGVGPRGGEPSGAAWSWQPAGPNPGWWDGEEPGNDEYWADLLAPGTAGEYDLAFRVTMDAGAHHVYCDRDAGGANDGSEDGYQIAHAAHLTVVPACAPDCPAVCGDGVVEAGETCDGDCPPDCHDGLACTDDVQLGAPGSCDVACLHVAVSACADGDGCCPAGCTPASDGDCPATCGDGRRDPGETCDGDCPQACDDGNPCTHDRLVGSAASCTAACSTELSFVCTPGDGCCPAGCDRASDSDCSPSCGDGIVDLGELCDGDCPASCDDGVACTADVRTGSAATCNLACTHPTISQCGPADGCCPAGCDRNRDPDCSATCGNGHTEDGELCDGDCARWCDDGVECTTDVLTGSPETCNAVCSYQRITTCRDGDDCCPAGCNALVDDDCSPTCGNGLVEPGETCDPCNTFCFDANYCSIIVTTGSWSTCSYACTFQPISQCRDADGCCPQGCDASRDTDCEAVCGNGIVEPGERCEGDCPTSCDDGDPCTVDTLSGSAARCTAACTHAPYPCQPTAADSCADAFTAVVHSVRCDGSDGTPRCVPNEQTRACGEPRLLACDDGRCALCLNEGGWGWQREPAGDGEQLTFPFETGGPARVDIRLDLVPPDDPADGYSQLVALTVRDGSGRVVAVSDRVWDTDNVALYDPCAGAASLCDRGGTSLVVQVPARGAYELVVDVMNAQRRVSWGGGFLWEDHWLRFDLAIEGPVLLDAALWRAAVFTPAGERTALPVPDGDPAGVEALADVVPCQPFALGRGQARVVLSGAASPADVRLTLTHDGVEAVVWDHQRPSTGTAEFVVPLSAFAGRPAGGAWRLRVVDDVPGHGSAGTLTSFSLDLRGW